MTPASAEVEAGGTAVFTLQVGGGASGSTARWTCASSDTGVATASVTDSGCSATGVATGDVTITANIEKGGAISTVASSLSVMGASSFGSGIWIVNEEIAPGRYFANPVSGCYWTRLSGTSGSFDDILANEFIGFDSGQEIVDISGSDYAFESTPECGTWSQTALSGPSGIPPGRWLVGRQIQAGEYETNSQSGCYWARLSGFSGTSEIIANDFSSDAGRQIVTISASDEGFYSSDTCGMWSRRGSGS